MWLDRKYIGIVSGRLDRFERVDDRSFKCRCPICGDSEKNKTKTRGYFLEGDNGRYGYYCHNCHYSGSLDAFLKEIDPTLHEEYVNEKLKEKYGGESQEKTDVEVFADKMKKPVFIKKSALNNLPKISQLPWDHMAKQYVADRRIPNQYHCKLFYTDKFFAFTNSVIPDKFSNKALANDHPRLIIPLIDSDLELVGFQGRALTKDAAAKYITISLDRDKNMIFNADTVDRSKEHFILEGPIDAMFIDNSAAMTGQHIDWSWCNENTVFVFDNEPRNKYTTRAYEQAIDRQHKVMFWPEDIGVKDINDVALQYPHIDINTLVRDNIAEGLEAKLLLQVWRKT